jgi:hypothetical protein
MQERSKRNKRNETRQRPSGTENGKETEKAAQVQHPQPADQTPNSSGAQYE